MTANLTCHSVEEQDQESGDGNETDSDEEVWQPVYGIHGGWRPWEGYPDIMRWVKGIPKIIFKTHVTVEVFLYIYYYNIEGQEFSVMEGGGCVRDQVRKWGRHKFCISEFLSVINSVEILLINQEVGNKKGWETEDIVPPIGLKK